MSNIADLYSILGGGAWLLGETAKEIAEYQDKLSNKQLVQAFVAKNTDRELEMEYVRKMEDSSNHPALWERLEAFKRDNPVWCMQHSEQEVYFDQVQTFIHPPFGWQDIGHKRVPMAGSNRRTILHMLLQTHGKMRQDIAIDEASKRFPLPGTK